MKKVLIISSSLRHNSNSELIADEFAKGAVQAGHEVEKVSLKGKNIAFCKGCLSCIKTGSCFIKDDAIEITEKMKNAEVIAFATPVYYYSMSGQLKTLLDRANSLYDSDYKFKDIYLLATAAENERSAAEGTIKGIQGWVDCFERAELKGIVFGGGIDDAGAAVNHQDVMKAAFKLGKNI